MDDMISRKAAKEVIRNKIVSASTVVRMWDMLDSVPAVDAAPVVHGNWIECYERSHHYYCSNCGKVQGIASIVMKYCPECGAKMAEHPWAGRYADQSGAEYADNPTV